MGADVFSTGLSSIESARVRISNSAHNVANLLTRGHHSVRTRQVSALDGGVRSITEGDRKASEVDLPREIIEQKLAALQAKGSVRVVKTALDMEESLIDIFV